MIRLKNLLPKFAFLAISMAWGQVLAAQDANPVVVELYTSQGCSSCPPADAMIEELANRSDVIALALHVDYWDYLGWKDTMGDPAYSDRQRAYARVAGSRSIYTPQMIIGGHRHIIGAKAMQVADAIAHAAATDYGVDIRLRRQGNRVLVTARSEPGLPNRMIVQLVRYHPGYDVEIKRGENRGRTITYANTVTEWREIGNWNGRKDLELRATAAGDQPVVVIIQEQGPGRIVAAARVN